MASFWGPGRYLGTLGCHRWLRHGFLMIFRVPWVPHFGDIFRVLDSLGALLGLSWRLLGLSRGPSKPTLRFLQIFLRFGSSPEGLGPEKSVFFLQLSSFFEVSLFSFWELLGINFRGSWHPFWGVLGLSWEALGPFWPPRWSQDHIFPVFFSMKTNM